MIRFGHSLIAVVSILVSLSAFASSRYDELDRLFKATPTAELRDFPSSAIYTGQCLRKINPNIKIQGEILAVYVEQDKVLGPSIYVATLMPNYPLPIMNAMRGWAESGHLKKAYVNPKYGSLISWSGYDEQKVFSAWLEVRKGVLPNGKTYFLSRYVCNTLDGCKVHQNGFEHLPKGGEIAKCYFYEKLQ